MTSRFLTILTAAGLAVAAAPLAQAQTNGWGDAPAAYPSSQYPGQYPTQYPGNNARRTGYDNGYRDGLRRGEQALRDRRPFEVERERDYRQAQGGYDRSYGDQNRYRDDYRAGFAEGYREAYNGGAIGTSGRRGNGYGYGRGNGQGNGYGYGRDSGYGGTANYGAYQNGASDGYRKGLDDLNARKSPDVTRQKWYRDGDHDYNSRYGSRETYRIEYRRGFDEGYRRAYGERRY